MGTAIIVATFTLITGICAVLYPNRSLGVAQRDDIPGPRGFPCVGNLISVYKGRRNMIGFMRQLHANYGPLSTFTLPAWGRTIVINCPEWLAHVKKNDVTRYSRGPIAVSIFEAFPGLQTPVASEGPAWRKARQSIQPIFLSRSFQNHVVAAMNELVPVTVALLGAVAEAGIVIDWNGRMALSIFCKSAFKVDTEMLRKDVGCLQETDVLIKNTLTLNEISASRLFNPYWHFTEKFDGTYRLFDTNIKELWKVVENLVALSLSTEGNQDETDFLRSFRDTYVGNDPVFVRNIMVTLLFGGRDNTQSSISWALYELLRHPEWIQKMREEALALERSGKLISFATVSSYVVHLAVFYEALRLWPGIPKNARYALQDDVLPSIPERSLPEVRVSKGTYLLWSDYIIMRDPVVWGPDAETFNPGRHISPDGKFIKPTTPNFIGFGAGPRSCPAAQLVPCEWVMIFSSILPLFDFEAVDRSEMYAADSLTNQMARPFFVRVRHAKERGDGRE